MRSCVPLPGIWSMAAVLISVVCVSIDFAGAQEKSEAGTDPVPLIESATSIPSHSALHRSPVMGISDRLRSRNEKQSWVLYGKYADEIDAGKRVTLTGEAFRDRSKSGEAGSLRISIGQREADVQVSESQWSEIWSEVPTQYLPVDGLEAMRIPRVQIKMEGVLVYNKRSAQYCFDEGEAVQYGETPFDAYYPDGPRVVSYRYLFSDASNTMSDRWSKWKTPHIDRTKRPIPFEIPEFQPIQVFQDFP